MKKYENFCAALNNLQDIFNYDLPYSNLILTGMVALYEICFEQAWKLMKQCLSNYGYAESATGSPKTVLKTAYQAGMITNETMWLRALEARNHVAHAYNQEIALEIIQQTKKDYYNMFQTLQQEIQKNWLQDERTHDEKM